MTLKSTLDNITKFISFWYMRYLLSTEMYIVEPWERAVMHVVIILFVIALSCINIVLLGYLSYAVSYVRTLI